MVQIMIYDKEAQLIHGGIKMDNGDVICGCCGGLIEVDDFGESSDCQHIILKEFKKCWVDLTDEITGDDISEFDPKALAVQYPY